MSRRLNDEERDLWERVAKSARRLREESRALDSQRIEEPKAPVPAPKPGKPALPVTVVRPAPAKPLPLKPAPSPRTRLDLAPSLHEALSAAPLRMDAGTHRKMSRGKLEPEARIDLHGMTREEAREALMGFVLAARGRGLRLLLVITGKGRERPDHELAPMPSRAGTLRHDLPYWLEHPLLRQAVLELRPAHRSHGGGGAFYLYLRRSR